jgi:hypothetical protein
MRVEGKKAFLNCISITLTLTLTLMPTLTLTLTLYYNTKDFERDA